MTEFPVMASPLRMAELIGDAPRYLGETGGVKVHGAEAGVIDDAGGDFLSEGNDDHDVSGWKRFRVDVGRFLEGGNYWLVQIDRSAWA